MAANSRLQDEIDQQIQLLRKHAEKNSILLAEAQRRRRLAAAAELIAAGENNDDADSRADAAGHQRSHKVRRYFRSDTVDKRVFFDSKLVQQDHR